MSVCDPEEGMHALFSGVLPHQIIAELPTNAERREAFDRLLEKHADELAGIIVEPLVQGAGGMIFHEAEVLRHIRAGADRHGLLLILDEIFTGFGRTGTMFACAAAKIVPDIITLSKALTGGTLGLGATIASASVFEAFLSERPDHALMHGPTFMGNPLACAAANASLDLFETEPRLAQVARISARLASGLEPCRNLPGVRDVRVKGAIGVVELDEMSDLEDLKRRFVAAGVFVRPFGKIVYLTPAFTIEDADLAELTGSIVSVLKDVSRNRAA
jgi:adenosylmethionine-8-amino-7-oxononanoate aminotransferase